MSEVTPLRLIERAKTSCVRAVEGLSRSNGRNAGNPYRDSWAEVAKENAYLLKRVNFCACFNMTVMAIVSPFISGFDSSTLLYVAAAALTLAFGVFCQFHVNTHLKLVKPLFYVLLAGMCAYAVALSAFLYPDIHGVTIVGIFMLIPTIILDETWRVNTILFLYYLAACAFAVLNKPRAIAIDDCVTTGAFVVFGMLIGSYLRTIRVEAIIQRQQLKFQRDMDELTKLPNRRVLFETLDRLADDIDGIFMADIDEFKAFNDFRGHQAGDDYLRRLGELFAAFSTQNGISIFRYGGEEFLGLCPAKTPEEMRSISRRLVESVRRENILGAGVTLSVGYSYKTPASQIGAERLISIADEALYEAKRQGRDRAVGRAGTVI